MDTIWSSAAADVSVVLGLGLPRARGGLVWKRHRHQVWRREDGAGVLPNIAPELLLLLLLLLVRPVAVDDSVWQDMTIWAPAMLLFPVWACSGLQCLASDGRLGCPPGFDYLLSSRRRSPFVVVVTFGLAPVSSSGSLPLLHSV